MSVSALHLAYQLDPKLGLDLPEVALILDITEAGARRLIGNALPEAPTVGDVIKYHEDNPHRLARRPNQRKQKFFVWLTEEDAERLRKAQFKVVDPRAKQREGEDARRGKAFEKLYRIAGGNAS